MPQLTLVPLGGLCNRLRAIASVRHFLEHAPEWQVRVAWRSHPECAASWSQLFTPHCWQHERMLLDAARRSDAPVTRRNLHLPALLRYWQGYDAQWNHFHSSLSPSALRQELAGYAQLYIATGYELLPTPSESWAGLEPQPWISERIAALTHDFDSHTIGLHIRRTDHVMSRRHSPDHLWIAAIETAVARDARTRFYLATDDAQLKHQLKARYPERIVAQHCRGTRSDLLGMEEAVIDLFALSRCARLLGSYWSSFSDTAATLGGMPFEPIKVHA